MIPLPKLPYPADALEPVISQTTMVTHHDKHHAKYVETVNREMTEDDARGSLEDVIAAAGFSRRPTLFNAAAQAWNHAFFWNCMSPAPTRPSPALETAINAAFGDLAGLRTAFLSAGLTHFGSGWVWLAAMDGGLKILTTHDAETLSGRPERPLLVCDVWEHAYYLDYKNDRAKYLGLWWDKLANWDFANAEFAAPSGVRWAYPALVETYVTPIQDHHAFERALEEAGMLLGDPPQTDTPHGRRFGALLGRIAQYEPNAPAVGSLPKVSEDLDRRIRAAARNLETPRLNTHWEPMLGGEFPPGA
ncbi:superoxide dismutase [Caulobacter sp. NIBR2454]|uniref:superoxide dismutase n=1 Tax=Caulobacter sp. NIBR2454 TaxID=3015996 RepID=UPI0022B6594D|nr:superoxide dismutase [Caulobacter sp. NIBR2454]